MVELYQIGDVLQGRGVGMDKNWTNGSLFEGRFGGTLFDGKIVGNATKVPYW